VRAAVLLLVLVLLGAAGCAGGPKYACGVPDGVGCRSVTEIYEASVAGTLSRARPPAADGDEEETAESPRGEALGPPARAPIVATVQPGDPVLTRPRVIRVWVARWEDRAGDLHDETYLYLRLDNGTWMLP